MSSQLTLWGHETGADIQTEIEKRGFAVIEHGISPEVIDHLSRTRQVYRQPPRTRPCHYECHDHKHG